MSASELAVKIESLPEKFRLMAEEYVEFLLDKAYKNAVSDSEWSEVLNKRAKLSQSEIEHNRLFTTDEVRQDFKKKISELKG